jgi:hypothetical protein
MRANDWLQDAVSRQWDGIDLEGFDNFLRLRSLDYLAVGRRLFYVPDDGPLEYLDPCMTHYNMNTGQWIDNLTGRKLPREQVYVDHTQPIGSSGFFVSPIAMVMPSAILAWLIREHDTASLDGRKVREVIIVKGKKLVESIRTALVTMMNLYTDPTQEITSSNIPVAYLDDDQFQGKVDDLIGRLSITSIPENFDRDSFMFQFVNEVGAVTGLALRHFWNSEKATNRALEEIQQQRQAQKGPETFIRSEQRILNRRGILRKKFGPSTRMAFFEEVDAQSQKIRSEVLMNNAAAFKIFSEVPASGDNQLSLEALIAWQQSEDVLPPEMDFLEAVTVKESDPDNLTENVEQSDPRVSQLGKSVDILDYDEITINSRGEIIEKRLKVFPVIKALAEEMAEDPEIVDILEKSETVPSFESLLKEARQEQHRTFLEKISTFDLDDPDRFQDFDTLDDSDFRYIDHLLNHEPDSLQNVPDGTDA